MNGRKRKTKLYNIFTEKIIEAKSISEFCRRAGLRKNHNLHITPILDGERLQHKGWVLPQTFKRKEIIADIYGNEYHLIDILKVYRRNQLTLTSLKKLLDGKIDFYKGLFLKSKSPLFKKRIKYKFKFQKGDKIITTTNLSSLSRKFGVSCPHNFYHHIYGDSDSAYGYKLTKIEPFILKKKLIKYIKKN